MIKRTTTILCTIAALLFFSGCEEDKPTEPNPPIPSETTEGVRGDWIRIFQPSDPDALHPLASTHATATFIKESQVYQYLCDLDPETLESTPILAKSVPTVSEDGLSFTYEIRPEATWDNGDPIDGHDYAFTFKAILNPLSEAPHVRVYYQFVKSVVVDPDNPRKFTATIDKPFFLAETSLSGTDVLSRRFFDPQDHLAKYTVADFHGDTEAMSKDADLIAFSEEFHQEKYMRDPAFVYGSGPYKVTNWTVGDNVTLERKEKWWGDKLPELGYGFQAYPAKIIYKTISDRSTALQAAASGELDIMRDITPDDFTDARENGGAIKDNFNMYTPNTFVLSAIVMNCRPPAGRTPFLEDLRVRKAICHLVDNQRVIDNIYGGFGAPATGPILPHQKEYNSDIQPYEFNPEKAKALLDEAGWIDSNDNGIRDKMIKGKKVEFEITMNISASSKTAPRMANMLIQDAEKVGLKISLNPLDFRVATKKAFAHDFDLFGTAFAASPLPPDLRQVWHTDSWLQNSTNYMGFGDAHSDSLIDKIRVTLSAEERQPFYDEIQELIHDAAPAIFLMCPQDRLIIHKRFKNAQPTRIRPGYKIPPMFAPLEDQKFKAEAKG